MEDLRKPSPEVYRRMVNYMKNSLRFRGASGMVDIVKNDYPNHLAIWQVRGNESARVGVVTVDGVRNLSSASGLRNDSWTPAPDDEVVEEDESFPVLAVVIPTLAFFFCGIVCYAAYSGRAAVASRSNANQI